MSKIRLFSNILSARRHNINLQRGDSLIEVMLAMAVLGVVVVGCMSVMNKASQNMLDSVERVSVRSDIDSQTELLNYMRDNHVDSNLWDQIKSKAVDNVGDIGDNCTKNDNSFYLYRSGGQIVMGSGSAVQGENKDSRAVPGDGIWIDAVAVTSNTAVPYIDFYVKSCWSRVGIDISSKSSTVVRLYDSSIEVVVGGADDTDLNSYYNVSYSGYATGLTTELTGGSCSSGRTIEREIRWKHDTNSWSEYTAYNSGTKFQLESPHAKPGSTYYFQQKIKCIENGYSGSWSEIGEYSKLIPVSPPDVLSISNAKEGSDVTFTRSDGTCPIGAAIQYQYSYRLDGDSFSSWVDWGSDRYTVNSQEGHSYSLKAHARCNVAATSVTSDWSGDSNVSTYVFAPSTPVAPNVAVNGGDNTVFSFSGSTCSSGTTLQYQYRTRVAEDGFSAWTITSNNSFTWNGTTTASQRYAIEVQARCLGATVDGSWSGTGSGNYVRPISIDPADISVYWSDFNNGWVHINGGSCPANTSVTYRVWIYRSDGALLYDVWNGSRDHQTYTGWQGYHYWAYATAYCTGGYASQVKYNDANTGWTYRGVDAPATVIPSYWYRSGNTVFYRWSAPSCGPGVTSLALRNSRKDYYTTAAGQANHVGFHNVWRWLSGQEWSGSGAFDRYYTSVSFPIDGTDKVFENFKVQYRCLNGVTGAYADSGVGVSANSPTFN